MIEIDAEAVIMEMTKMVIIVTMVTIIILKYKIMARNGT